MLSLYKALAPLATAAATGLAAAMLSVFDQGTCPPCPAPFNLAEYALRHAMQLPQKDALLCLGPSGIERWSYAQLRQAVLGTATGLRAAGLRPGNKLLLRLGNSVDFPLAFLGAIAAGIIPVPSAAQLTAAEVGKLIDILSPRAILRDPALSCATHPQILSLDKARGWRALPETTPERGDPNRLAYVVFTSGTSGLPRAVGHAHRAIWARQMMIADWADLRQEDRLMHAGAFNWTYTLGTGLLDPWSCGATSVIPAPGTQPCDLPGLIAAHQITLFAAAPGLYRQMLRAPDGFAGHALRHGLSAGEKLPPSIAHRWEAATGTRLHEAYGMSECSTFISAAPHRPAQLHSIGQPQRGRRIAVMGSDGPVEIGTPGTLAVHRDDPGLMLGYLGADKATAARYQGEWFLTGDQAVADANFQITYLGRDDDMINAGGLRVSPLEIEQVLSEMPQVTAVAAVETRIRGDTSIIIAYYTAPAKVDATLFNAYVEDRLARYKQPRRYIHIAEMPMGANGKVLRRALRQREGLEHDENGKARHPL